MSERSQAATWIGMCALLVAAQAVNAQGAASARGRVLADSSEVPIGGATVSIPRLRITVLSDSLGNFALAGIEPGDHLVIVRRVGFAPVSSVVHFAPGDSLDADFLMAPLAQQLATVDVRGEHLPAKLAEFADRRALGIGHFLTGEEIAKLGSTKVTDMTRVLPGAVLVRANGRGDVYIGSSRGAQSTLRAGRNRPCPAEIILDGVVMLEGTETQVNTAIQPSEIAAVEWYSGAAEVPQKYNRTKNACAVLVIWTR